MWFKREEAKIKNTLRKNILVSYEVSNQSKQCITTTTCCIPKCLQGHDLPEERIKKINTICYELFHLCGGKSTNCDRI